MRHFFGTTLLLCLACVFLVSSCKAQTMEEPKEPDEFFYIFLCFGQSNMVGKGEITEADKVVDKSFLSLSTLDGPDGRKVGQWRLAVPPLCRYNSGMSLVDFFGRTMRKNYPDNVRIGVVYVAVDGCAIDLFDKDGYKNYTDTITRRWLLNEIAAYGGNPYKRMVDMAKKAQKYGVIRGILFHQGETDAYGDRWLQKVKKIYGDLMSDLHLDSARVPLIAGEAVNEDQNGVCAHINPVINRLPEVIPNCYVVSSKGCEAASDRVHFTTQGYRTLGTRYGIKMLKSMGFEISDGYEETLGNSTTVAVPDKELDVVATLDSKGMMHAVSATPIEKVEYVSFSGEKLKTIVLGGVKEVDVDTRLYPNEYPLVIVFHGEDGSSVSISVTK